MPLQATSGAASYDAFGGGVPVVPNYIEEVFSTWLYTGTGATNQTITNGIDLAGKGGMVWIKQRNAAIEHFLYDTTRGALNVLESNSTTAAYTASNTLTAFGSTGFTLGSSNFVNGTTSGPRNYASWTFREQPKFFDVVTLTADGSGNATFSHNLGATPGCVILKRTDGVSSWVVWHRGLTSTNFSINLNTTSAQADNGFAWITPGSSTVSINGGYLGPNTQWVAYLFAHNAGGFGLSGTDNVISCGSFTTDGSGFAPTVNLGYEPQFVLFKESSQAGQGWYLMDVMRGMNLTSGQALQAQSSAAETTPGNIILPTATGFTPQFLNANTTHIYIAIRRGPMKVPTTGTSVFAPATHTGTGSATTITSAGFPVDLVIGNSRNAPSYGSTGAFGDRLRGRQNLLYSPSTGAQDTTNVSITGFDVQNGISVGNTDAYSFNFSGGSYVNWFFRRAPGFFDVVCYTGNGSTQNVAHNLGVVPELLIIKRRNGTGGWESAVPSTTAGRFLVGPSTGPISLNTINNNAGESSYAWASNTGTATYFNPEGIFWNGNVSGATYVAYLFASCPGVSRVGTYTGNGSSQTINCGFTSGARFVMIKSVLSAGNWIVADSARGIVANNDPALYLNSTAAEITGFDWIDADSTGFVVNETATIAANSNGNQYIFLAIA